MSESLIPKHETLRLYTVTPCHGRPDLVSELLSSLRRVAEEDLGSTSFVGIIIVDSTPEDSPAAGRIRACCEETGVYYVRGPISVRAKRNLGARLAHAQGADIVLFIDSDCQAQPGLLREHLAAYEVSQSPFTHRPVGAAAGVTKFIGPDSTAFRAAVQSPFLDPFSFAECMPEVPFAPCTNFSVRLDVFKRVGGFAENWDYRLGGDDTEIGRRINNAGYAILSRPLAIVFHDKSTWNRWPALIERVWRWGRMDINVRRAEPSANRQWIAPQPLAVALLLCPVALAWGPIPFFRLNLVDLYSVSCYICCPAGVKLQISTRSYWGGVACTHFSTRRAVRVVEIWASTTRFPGDYYASYASWYILGCAAASSVGERSNDFDMVGSVPGNTKTGPTAVGGRKVLESFWAIIAQVSATFAGLVFTGFSIYLGNIREATAEVKRKLPESREVSGGLIYIVVYSNLLFYWLPLLLSLTSLTERIYPQTTAAKVVFIGSLLLFFLLFCALHKSGDVRQQWQSIRNAARHLNPTPAADQHIEQEKAQRLRQAKRLRRQIWCRMRVGRSITAGNLLFILVLYLSHLLRSIEEWLMIWGIVNLGLGVAFSLIDLALFRPDNIFFTNFDRLVEQLESQARDIRNLMETLSRQFEEMQPSLSSLSEETYADLDRRYKVLRNQIPESGTSLSLIQEFRELGPIASVAELRGYGSGLSLLRGGVKDFEERLGQAQEALAEQSKRKAS